MRGLLFLLVALLPLREPVPGAVDTAAQAALAQKVVQALAPHQDASAADLLVLAARQVLGTPYVGGTLDEGDSEELRVYLDKTDCILLVETCLGLARAVREAGAETDYDLLCEKIRQTRYRDGVVSCYSDRIHYTAEWVFRGEAAGLFRDVSLELGGAQESHPVSYMTNHYMDYPHLADAGHDPAVRHDLEVIAEIEKELTDNGMAFIPKDRLPRTAQGIRTGDILCFTSGVYGLDIAHVAIALWQDGVLTFIHASPAAGKVVVEGRSVASYLQSRKNMTGVKVVRPLF